jgi:hypothetical protein
MTEPAKPEQPKKKVVFEFNEASLESIADIKARGGDVLVLPKPAEQPAPASGEQFSEMGAKLARERFAGRLLRAYNQKDDFQFDELIKLLQPPYEPTQDGKPIVAFVEEWLEVNGKSESEVYWIVVPIGMLSTWIQRAADAERQLAEANSILSAMDEFGWEATKIQQFFKKYSGIEAERDALATQLAEAKPAVSARELAALTAEFNDMETERDALAAQLAKWREAAMYFHAKAKKLPVSISRDFSDEEEWDKHEQLLASEREVDMTKTQRERLEWLEHVLQDADAGRFYSREQLAQMNEERELLRELASEVDNEQ